MQTALGEAEVLWDSFHTILKYKENQKLGTKRSSAFMLELHLPQEVLRQLEHDIFLLLEKMKGKTREGLI